MGQRSLTKTIYFFFWIVLILVGLLLLWKLSLDRPLEAAPSLDIAKENAMLLTAEFVANLEEVQILNKMGIISLEKHQGEWKFKTPLPLPPSEIILKKLFSLLQSLSIQGMMAADLESKKYYSLENPPITFTLKSSLGSKIVQVGLRNEGDLTSYIFVEGEQFIYSVRANFSPWDKEVPLDMASKKVFQIDWTEVESLSLSSLNKKGGMGVKEKAIPFDDSLKQLEAESLLELSKTSSSLIKNYRLTFNLKGEKNSSKIFWISLATEETGGGFKGKCFLWEDQGEVVYLLPLSSLPFI